MDQTTIIAIAAVSISFFSMLFSVLYARKSLRITISHNQKTVRPALSSYGYAHFDNLSKYLIKHDIKNSGLGPAILEDLKFTIENKEFETLHALLKQENASYSEALRSSGQIISSFEDTILAPGEVLKIFDTGFLIPAESEEIKKVNLLMYKIEIKVNYRSLYDENFEHTSRIASVI